MGNGVGDGVVMVTGNAECGMRGVGRTGGEVGAASLPLIVKGSGWKPLLLLLPRFRIPPSAFAFRIPPTLL